MNAAAPLVFNWALPRKRVRALIFFLIGSVILHALCFYIFQIVYPPTVALLPPPARLNIISPNDPESLALLRWVEAEDPALTTTTQRPPDAKSFVLPKLEHLPSYATHEPVLRTLPQNTPNLTIPSMAAIGPVRVPQLNAENIPASVARKTTAYFSELPGSLAAPVLPEFKFNRSRPDAPVNAGFRIAIDPRGAVQFCFLTDSSGDPSLDEQARNFLQLCRFPTKEDAIAAGSTALIWTTATVLWGNDIAPRSASSPAP